MTSRRTARIPRVLQPGEPIPDIPLIDMDLHLLCEVVSRDVRNNLPNDLRAELRSDQMRDRWVEALDLLVADVDEQLLVEKGKDDAWRHKIGRFREELERRRDEALGNEDLPIRPVRTTTTKTTSKSGASNVTRNRVTQLEAAIAAHRDHECDDDCDDGCPADEQLWALID